MRQNFRLKHGSARLSLSSPLAGMILFAPVVMFVSGFIVANVIVVFAVWQGVALRDLDVLASFGFALIWITLFLVTVSVKSGVMPGFPIFYDLRWLQIVLLGFAVLIGVGLRSWWWVVILTTTSITAMLGLEFWHALDAGHVQRMENWQYLAPAYTYSSKGGFFSSPYSFSSEFGYHDILALTFAAAGAIALAAAVGTALGNLIAPRSGSRQFATWSYFVVAGFAGYSVRDVDFFLPGSVLAVMVPSFLCGLLVRTQWSLAFVPLAAIAGGLAYQGLMISDIGVFRYWSELNCHPGGLIFDFEHRSNCSIYDESNVIKVSAFLAMLSVALGRLVRFVGTMLRRDASRKVREERTFTSSNRIDALNGPRPGSWDIVDQNELTVGLRFSSFAREWAG